MDALGEQCFAGLRAATRKIRCRFIAILPGRISEVELPDKSARNNQNVNAVFVKLELRLPL